MEFTKIQIVQCLWACAILGDRFGKNDKFIKEYDRRITDIMLEDLKEKHITWAEWKQLSGETLLGSSASELCQRLVDWYNVALPQREQMGEKKGGSSSRYNGEYSYSF